jgi:cardiolipin synthase
MYVAIQEAKKSIFWELYIFIDDDVGCRFFDLLEKKAEQGLEVKIIIDGLGSGYDLPKKRSTSLEKSGVDLRIFSERKHHFRGWWRKMISRTHRKILIIDEHIGFIGGVNIDKRMQDWLDMHAKIEGKAVRSLMRAFAKMYVICGGSRKSVQRLLRYPWSKKEDVYEFVYENAGDNVSQVRRIYVDAFKRAKKRIILFTPYYFPDKAFLYALWQARRRKVRIDLLIPFRSDLRIATYAAYAWFSLMKLLGVHIHVSSRMMHGKGIVVDDDWAMIGSSNIDHTSFYDHYEANVKIKDKKAVRKIIFKLEEWLLDSQKIDYQRWKRRSRWHRVQEWIALNLYVLWHKKGRGIKLDRIIEEIKLRRLKKEIRMARTE